MNFDIFGTPATTTAGTSKSSIGKISLVSPDNTHVYAIISGKKHLIPTEDVLREYDYKIEYVKAISQSDLARYPRVNLVKVRGDSKRVYYLTEGGMVRLMPSEKVMDSYGVRKEDAITISKREFNFYPQNQYIYLESPLNRDVFQIVDSKSKRYLTPMAVQRLGIQVDHVTPVNQIEMDSYKILTPVVQ